jgi:hypothetical protein
MGSHSRRLAASRAHRRCVAGIRLAIRKTGREIPGPRDISPKIVGAQLLPVPIPPTLEEALGYRGALRFVALGYNPRTRHFCHSDGGDDLPADGESWPSFLRHPIINPHLHEERYPSLYGGFTKEHDPIRAPWFLVDREERHTYICPADQLMLLFALAEPEDGRPINLADGRPCAPAPLAHKRSSGGDSLLKITAPPLIRR